MGLYVLHFPELGEGLHEGRIEKWLVKPGDEVKEDDALAEVENDKATVELPSPVDGRIVELKVADGSTVVVGDLILTLEVAGAGNADEKAAPPAAALEPEKAPAEPAQGGAAQEQHGAAAPAEKTQAKTAGADAQTQTPESAVPAVSAREILATPGVRKFAREQGVNISLVSGAGPHGKITREDVAAYLAGDAAATAISVAAQDAGIAATAISVAAQDAGVAATVSSVAAPATDEAPLQPGSAAGVNGREERVPLTSIRKIIAQSMVRSKHTAPHVTLMDETDVSELVRLRQEIKPLAAERGVKITYLPFVVKALVAAVRRFPQLNASLDEERQELILKRSYNIGIATDTERGLMVPVVHDADRKNMWAIASQIEDMAVRARTGKLMPAEMKGGTVSITNIGSAGGMFFTPIINYPEVAILGVGRITERPVMRDGQVAGAHMMALSLSFDHRIVDGATAQYAINEMKRLLADPKLLLMEV